MLGHDECVTALLEHKASALCRDTKGRTPLHYAASRGHTKILASLVQAAMETDPQDKLLDNKQYTPLHWAAYKGLLSLMPNSQTLMLHIITVTSVVSNAKCVFVCLFSGHEDCLEVLLEYKTFIHEEGNPFTPLHCAL